MGSGVSVPGCVSICGKLWGYARECLCVPMSFCMHLHTPNYESTPGSACLRVSECVYSLVGSYVCKSLLLFAWAGVYQLCVSLYVHIHIGHFWSAPDLGVCPCKCCMCLWSHACTYGVLWHFPPAGSVLTFVTRAA